MDKLLLNKIYNEYELKFNSIIEEYGEKDGFIIEGQLWWEYYESLIEDILKNIENNTLTEIKAMKFYKNFGFGPKLYGKTFIEQGLNKISKLFLYLANEDISASDKIKNLVEDQDSDNYFKGVGINFITLFLTSYFPNKYVQWNKQTDGALKILDLYPHKQRGEKRSNYYLKINEACKKIAYTINLDFMPKLDNILYCLNKGYIGSEFDIEEKLSEETEVIKGTEKEITGSKHDEIMYFLIKIGINKNYDVWVATNDKNKNFKGNNFSNYCLSELPKFTQPDTLSIAQYVDVIWFKKGTSYPVRFFEIENTTSIYSGLLRLNDVKIDYPLGKASIVIPNDRIERYESQIERRTFKYSELSDVCDYLTYKQVEEWYKAVSIDFKYS
ncbi:MAG: hypothetical protein ACOCRK_03880 [bacterium]